MKYKWPIEQSSKYGNKYIQQGLINKATGQEIDNSEKATIVGSVTVVVYFLTISYIYISALFMQNNLTGSNLTISNLISAIKSNKFFTFNTLSTSIEFSGKVGTTIFLIVFFALIQSLYFYQNIYTTDDKRATIIAFNYIMILCWLLLMFIFSSKTVPGGKKISSKLHFSLAFCIIFGICLNAFLLDDIYSVYFDTQLLKSIGYSMVCLAILSFFAMILNFNLTRFEYFTHLAVAITEMTCLILFGVFLIIFITYPPIPDANLECVMRF